MMTIKAMNGLLRTVLMAEDKVFGFECLEKQSLRFEWHPAKQNDLSGAF
ncbi:hypothetical protein P4B35_03245 [Pontiellaceae bacterium B12227]|nr:hypothetical protein [Pontiellaceae bacterium B12227]